MEKLQWTLLAVFFVALALIPWFLDHWWQLLITAVVALVAAAVVSNVRDERRC